MTDAISGFWVATPTPLTAEGTVDPARLADHARRLFKKGVNGVVLFGTTGEGTSFNDFAVGDTVGFDLLEDDVSGPRAVQVVKQPRR